MTCLMERKGSMIGVPYRRRAFTLTEILIAMVILSLILVLAYQIMTGMMRSGTVTQWEATLTNQFSSADSRIRLYLDRSSYPSLATPQGTARLDKNDPSKAGEAFYLSFPGDPEGVELAGSSVREDQVFLSWYCCEAGRKGVPGLSDAAPTGSKIELVAKNVGKTKQKGIGIFNLCMVESAVTFPNDLAAFLGTSSAAGTGGKSTQMVTDCSKIALKLIGRGSKKLTLPVHERVHVEIEITCVEPTQGNAIRSRKITGQANVGARAAS